MKNFKVMLSVGFIAISSACVPKVLLLQSPVVSATKKDAGNKKNLVEGKEIKEQWCHGDAPISDDGSNQFGLVDQVTLKAHKSHNADYFSNARYFTQGECIQLEALATSVGD